MCVAGLNIPHLSLWEVVTIEMLLVLIGLGVRQLIQEAKLKRSKQGGSHV